MIYYNNFIYVYLGARYKYACLVKLKYLQYLVNWTCTRPYCKSKSRPFAVGVRPLAVFSEITACVRVCTLRSVLFSSVLCVHVKTRCIYLHTVRGLRRVDRDDDHDVVRMHARVCHARRAFEDLNNYPGIIN